MYLIVLLVFYFSHHAQVQSLSECFFQKTCVQCLDANFDCAWCTDENYGMFKSRCLTVEQLKASNCSASKIETNANFSNLRIVEDKPLRDFDTDKLEAIQIGPQRVQIKLGKLEAHKFNFTYRPARNYPLDLYYLMDLTWSMRDDRDTLINMGDKLAKALANLTENYRLGFGSFIDKPIMPFIQTEPHRVENPCSTEHDVCGPTYGFRHRLEITQNIDKFIERLKTSSVSANLDNLEGGLDALMQVLVCKERIGWGENTRKIVILATNGFMHMAGDGLLAGITERNDKTCHLSETGEYTGTLLYDYPSLEEIYRVLMKSKIAVIFAVTEELQDYYKSLQGLIEDFASVGLLQDDSSNILQLVDTGYKNFVRRVEFIHDAPSFLDITMRTTCGGIYQSMQHTDECDNIEIGKEYIFEVEIRLKDYPPEQMSNLTVRIEEVLLSNEAVELEIDIRSTCQCEREEDSSKDSEYCRGNGDYQCGMCNCNAGWIGKTCECDLKNFDSNDDLLNQCRGETEYDEPGPICSDRGECQCGLCLCNPGFTGEHCECTECIPLFGLICSGHGDCDCGACRCHEGWDGDDCECTTDQTGCRAPHKKEEICSGRGDCECGECRCNGSYFGPYCEVEPGAESELCSYYEDCARYSVYQQLGKEFAVMGEDCKRKLGLYSAEFFDMIDETLNCTVRITNDDLTCDFKYTYGFLDDKQTILKILKQSCTQINVAASFAWIAAATVVVGLTGVLLYRGCIGYKDNLAYKKFEEEQNKQTSYHMESPLYKSPISKFSVPKEMAESEFK
ncbi:integrin beta-nu [Uranotaenia lowii]|uniref:integrin beta-nu n=1 Tax=Uranotaenia lowii TaxID=190385 RepID=UPI002479C1DE|nr:integrin beta-nu [Uranotaenia lowii]